MNKEIADIILRSGGKYRCLFNPIDPIYQLTGDEVEIDDKKVLSRLFNGQKFVHCNTCCVAVNSIKKIKLCHFCQEANCGQCLTKTRPFPKNNSDKLNRAPICQQCNKKFLYRDAINEKQIRIDFKDHKWKAKQ